MMAMGGRKWHLAVQLTAALSYVLLHLGHRIAVLGFSDQCSVLSPAGRGRQQYVRIAQTLRATAPVLTGGGSNLMRCALRIPPRHQVIVVSDCLVPDAMQTALRRIAAAGCRVQLMHVLDETEFDLLPSAEPVGLLDRETLQTRTVTLSGDVVQSVQQNWHTWCDDLRSAGARLGIGYTACDTHEHWKTIFLQYLKGFQVNHA
jgi:uncharacterized protein (DUF58 family)